MSSETLTNITSSNNELENFFNTSTEIVKEKTPKVITEENNITESQPEIKTVDNQTQPKTELENFFSEDKIDSNSLEGFIMSGEKPEISNLEKLEYGWDKETMVLGNLFRIGKAKVQDLFVNHRRR